MRILLVAATSVALVVTPFLGGCGDESAAPAATASPSASTAPSETPTEPSDVVVKDRQKADVDGDGRPDSVRVLLYNADPDEPGPGSVEVTLASGGAGAGASVPFGYPQRLLPPLDLNGDGREQVLLSFTAGGDAAPLLVYTWHDGGLVEAQVKGKAPLVLELDGEGTVAYYYVDDGVLHSWLRLDPVAGGPVFKVEQWSWSIEDDRLVATPAENACVDVTGSDPPQPC